MSAALVVGVSLVSILQECDRARVSTSARQYFQCISLLQIGNRIQCSVLFWALLSSHLVCKCQILTYIKSCRYAGLSGHISPQ